MRSRLSSELLIGLFVFFSILFLIPQKFSAQSCGTIGLDCGGCGGGIHEYYCCIPPGCLPIEISNGTCDNPAICKFQCNGNVTTQTYSCAG